MSGPGFFDGGDTTDLFDFGQRRALALSDSFVLGPALAVDLTDQGLDVGWCVISNQANVAVGFLPNPPLLLGIGQAGG